MRLMTEFEAKAILEPYIPKIHKAILDAVNSYFANPALALLRSKMSKRSDASICHDLIIENMKSVFEGESGIKCSYSNKLFLLVVKGQVVLRFNLFDSNKLSHGIQTGQLIAYNNQQFDEPELDIDTPDGLLYAGYLINPLRTGASNVFITCRYQNHNVWEWELVAPQPKITEITKDKDVQKPVRKRRVKPKNNKIGDVNDSAQ
ncbi:hypothetical protein [Paenibacillus sp. NPDC058177]|uniref:hypothetical protein n=1 Tax=Paenibacillus sp. NPDC058177 TaxID=3346369 RepID=UPI0036DF71F7